jgi:hypothetical protein|tara:strand:+ start:173 stop:703 length:531 start_codon:yes stop_codon:yes gene_type:complete
MNDLPQTTSADFKLILAIVTRARADIEFMAKVDPIDFGLDMEYTHHIIPLDLQQLLDADGGNFAHDVCGIFNHFNRDTRQMDDFFLPRFSKPEPPKLYISVVKMGRLADGHQGGHGVVRHAMDAAIYHGFGSHQKALCATKPGRRSVGFVHDEGVDEITCKQCQHKIEMYGWQLKQ